MIAGLSSGVVASKSCLPGIVPHAKDRVSPPAHLGLLSGWSNLDSQKLNKRRDYHVVDSSHLRARLAAIIFFYHLSLNAAHTLVSLGVDLLK
jgi:hypothetical protein